MIEVYLQAFNHPVASIVINNFISCLLAKIKIRILPFEYNLGQILKLH